MPEIGRIQSTNFQSLLTELGITRNNIPFALRSEVTPVVLVGGTVSFVAAPTPAYRITDISSPAAVVAPAAATVLADTGPLLIGAYSLQIFVMAQGANRFVIEWRDAPNTGTQISMEFGAGGGNFATTFITTRFDVLNDNERFRIVNIVAGVAGDVYRAVIMARP